MSSSTTTTVRSVSIGKGRRVTIDELVSVCVSGNAKLEYFGEEMEGLEQLSFDTSKLVGVVVGGGEEECLSKESRLAVLTVLSLAVAQCRLMSEKSSIAVTLALMELSSHCNNNNNNSNDDIALSSNPDSLAKSLMASCNYNTNNNDENENEFHTFFSSTLALLLIRIIPLSISALSGGIVRAFLSTADCMAALSAERMKIDPSICFSDTLFDTLRPHRGCITTAANLRAILQGSTYAKTTVSKKKKNGNANHANHSTVSSSSSSSSTTTSEDTLAIQNTPQYHGPAKDTILNACKTLELELNCSESNANQSLDTTIVQLNTSTLLSATVTLLKGSQTRCCNTIPPSSPSLQLSLEHAVQQLQQALQQEASTNVTFLQKEMEEAMAKAKQMEEEKAARAKAHAASQNTTQNSSNNSNEDEFAGMSEVKKSAILKKRAEKEAKAAAKRAAKKKNSSASDNQSSSLFGMGTAPILTLLIENTKLSLSTATQLSSLLDKLLSGGVQRKPKIAKGTRDYLPHQMQIRQQAFSIIRRVFQSHGAVEIDTPVFELKETLTGKYGEDSKLIYDLADQGGELLALRYDLTVPFARFLSLNPVGNIKRFHIGKVYRRDQPALAKGRYREFYQCDFDIAGTYGRMIPDSECLCVACEILDTLPIGNFAIKLNHRKLLDAILDLSGVPADKFRTICSAVDKLDKEPWSEVRREMVEDKGLKEDVADKIGTFVLQKGEPWKMYHALMESQQFGTHTGALTAMEDLKILFQYLEAMGKLHFISFDLSLARGLDYYTGVIYEAVCMSGNSQVGSIGGGGRYDNLVSMFQEAGKITPCVGVSVGIERVFTLMEANLLNNSNNNNSQSQKQSNVNVLIASAGLSNSTTMICEKMKVANILWNANISAEFTQTDNLKLKNEIVTALSRDIPFMVVVGEEEAKENKCKVKDLKARTEDLVDMDDLVNTLMKKKSIVPVGCEFAKEFMEKLQTE